MVPDNAERVKIDLSMDAFKNAKGLFGMAIAIQTRSKKSPADWWDSYGDEHPELKRFAIRILSLTCSSSGCERNWSAFEMVHSKRRNCLHQRKMNDLVFVMYNLKLQQRNAKRSNSTEPPICLDDLPSDDEWITEQEAPTLPTDSEWLGVLDRAARREAREAREESEDEGSGRVNVGDIRNACAVDAYVLSDDDNDVQVVDNANPTSACAASNDVDATLSQGVGEGEDDGEFEDVGDEFDDETDRNTTIGTDDNGDDDNFGYNSDGLGPHMA